MKKRWKYEKIGGNMKKKRVQKREKVRTVKSLNNVRFEILKNQSSVKYLEINEPNHDVMKSSR